MGLKLGEKAASFFFEYDTPRMVLVRNKKVGLIFRLIQLVVLGYIIGWVFLYEKGYQSQDGIISSVSVKLKGLTVTNISGMGPHVWDVADYVFPPQGDSSFVVMTNVIITPGQKQDICPELPDAGRCNNDSDCIQGKYSRQGQGIMTGKCVDFDSNDKTCEIFGWCPVEEDDQIPEDAPNPSQSLPGTTAKVLPLSGPPLLLEAENFTLFIKNSITFPTFKVSRRNLVEGITTSYLKKCSYHKNKDPLCPVFELGYIVKESGQNFRALAFKGGVVGITIDWDCDLDWPVTYCKPVYQFHGLYNDDNNVSPGFNFRYAKYYSENGTNYRTLYKVFGIRFDILVNGKAGKFNIIPTMTTIGSGIGIFGVASIVCDLLLLHFLPRRDYYKQRKFKYAEMRTPVCEKEEASPSSMSNLQNNVTGSQ
ncbi:P2X purinoceptor 1 isoform X1 [Chrysemys picta bellii]|uniref:P2X purinoceptor 1 isoform X1 n=1 Tax=Chrysemys picta bellii TaxID=8478 RepID=UPI001C674824|nr:P2X purinoceptor 1 isoform X1 [Chrysemys picta bellii]